MQNSDWPSSPAFRALVLKAILLPPPRKDAAIQAALELEAAADGEVKNPVLAAAELGASVRVLAECIAQPTSLISRWKRKSRT